MPAIERTETEVKAVSGVLKVLQLLANDNLPTEDVHRLNKSLDDLLKYVTVDQLKDVLGNDPNLAQSVLDVLTEERRNLTYLFDESLSSNPTMEKRSAIIYCILDSQSKDGDKKWLACNRLGKSTLLSGALVTLAKDDSVSEKKEKNHKHTSFFGGKEERHCRISAL